MKNKELSDENNVPEPEIQAQITNLMGLPPEEAPPTLNVASDNVKTAPLISDDDDNIIPSSIEKNNTDNFQQPAKTEPIKNNTSDIDEAVDDIIANDSDELLKKIDAESENLVNNFENVNKKNKNIFKKWWANKKIRNWTLVAIFLLVVAVMLIPKSRYLVLNTSGVRASMSINVVDKKYGKPIKNVEVTVAGVTAFSDEDGKVNLTKVKLGPTTMIIKKRSFSTVEEKIVVGWGSNPFQSPFELQPVGSTYKFVFTDWLSGKPIPKVEITDGESTAIADSNGNAEFITEPTDNDLQITTKAENYREEKIKIAYSDTAERKIGLVLAQPDVFVSKRSGKYDVYKRDLDGKNETVLLAGNGNEQEDISLLLKPKSEEIAFVSSREGKRNGEGYLLSNLYIINSTNKTVVKIEGTESEQIQLLGWVEDRLIFVKIIAGPSAANEKRQRLISYNLKDEKQTELASANYFNDVEIIKKQIYYAPSSAGLSNSAATAMLFKIAPDGSNKTVALNKEVWTIYRPEYDLLQLNAADNKWYQLNLADNKVTNMTGAPAIKTYKIYADNLSDNKTAWIDNRDGRGVLLIADPKDFKTEKALQKTAGLNYPIYWYSDEHIVYRVSSLQETANYVVNTDNNKISKIGDVTNTSPTSRWYYYR